MGLIAREIERRGIPTLCLSSAYSITQSVAPPRAVFLDFPLGHTAGRPHALTEQVEILESALTYFEQSVTPGEIQALPFYWAENDDWKASVMQVPTSAAEQAEADYRLERFDTPQYQTESDARVANPICPSCVFLSEPDEGVAP